MTDKIPKNKISFQHTFMVDASHIDIRGHVNNMVYLQWTQEVAYMHWDVLATDEIKKDIVWFVIRHEIDYLSQAFENETITVYTWIEDAKGVKSTRMFAIYRDEQLLAKCKTVWCLIDAKTQKLKRITNDILEIFIDKH